MNGLLHPGLDVALRRFEMTETDVARALAEGEMASPTHFVNSWYFRARISGTGYAYRPALAEYVERLPEHYVTPEFLDRCQGLPVVWLHPDAQVLDSKSFGRQVVGTIVLPYIGGPDGEDPASQEVWGVARIIDEGAALAMSKRQLSTSPAVVLGPDGGAKEPMENGRHLLREGKPFLLDHLAICDRGVWDKLGPPTGIDNVNLRADSAHNKGAEAMAEEHKEVTEEKKDATGEVPNADLKDIFKKMDALATMADAVCKRMDAMEEERKADRARRDAEEEERRAEADAEEEEAKKKADASAEKEREQSKTLEKLASEEAHEAEEAEKKDDESEEGTVKTDKKRGDGEEEKEVKSDARVDALVAKLDAQTAELEELKRKVAERPVADADAMADAQAKADAIYSALGERAAAPMMGETVVGYRVRMVRGLQKHSKAWEKTDVASMARHDSDAFSNIEAAVYADATAAARDPNVLGGGEGLRQRVRQDSVTGQRIIEWYGNPLAWMGRFMPADQFCTRLGPAPRQ